MLILNVDIIKNKISCNKEIADYLISKGIPILGVKEGLFYFSLTSKVNELIKNFKERTVL